MTVLHLCSDFDQFHVGISDALFEIGVDSRILAYKLRKTDFKKFYSKSKVIYLQSDVKYRRTPFFHHSRIKTCLKYLLKQIPVSTTLIHSHMLFTDGFLAYKIKKLLGINYIVTVRNSDVNYKFLWRLPWTKKTAIKVLLDSKKIVFISPSHKSRLLEFIPLKYKAVLDAKCVTIPNGVSRYWHENKAESRSLRNRVQTALTLTTVGDIEPNKNQLAVAGFINRINKELNWDIKYKLAGRIVNYSYYKKLVACDNVSYLGLLDRNEMKVLYSKTDIFVLISLYETFGLVYVEAMTQGLPVLYTKGQGIDGYFSDGTIGYAINPNSYEEFKTGISKIVDNYESISHGCTKMSMEFTWEKISGVFRQIYDEILNV